MPTRSQEQLSPASSVQLTAPPLPYVRDGIGYGVLDDIAAARDLFAFAAAPCPPKPDVGLAWAAWADSSRLVGTLFAERHGRAALLWGPVVRERTRALDIAGEVVAVAIGQTRAAGVDTLFARPQGLDRIWVRFGFIPVPEGTLPAELRGCPGAGLFGYRGGSAIWSQDRSAGRYDDHEIRVGRGPL